MTPGTSAAPLPIGEQLDRLHIMVNSLDDRARQHETSLMVMRSRLDGLTQILSRIELAQERHWRQVTTLLERPNSATSADDAPPPQHRTSPDHTPQTVTPDE